MRVVLVPVLSDNYAYLLVDSSGVTAVVDPAEPDKLLAAASREGVNISTVLTTHHHWDHAGGNEEMARRLPGVPIYGGANDNVPACTHPVSNNQTFSVGNINIRALETPYHTLGHVCYLCEEPGSDEKIIFTGDTMFVGGCGRCFAGTPEQMYFSLIETLSKLPPDTRMYCGHEYTVKNLEFAASADKENSAVQQKLQWARQQRAQGLPTIPSTIGEELQYNPFLRCSQQALAAYAGRGDPVANLAELRKRKDAF